MTTRPATATEQPLLTRAFLLLALGELAYFTADGAAIYLVPVHATGPLGSDGAGAGLAFGAFAVSALLLRPLAGRICDTRGRRPLLVGGAAVAAVSMALTSQVEGLAALVALRLLAGVAEAAVFVGAFAAVADLAPADRLGEAISYNSLALYLGLAVGPPVGEWLAESHGFAAAWYGAALVAVLAVAAMAAVGETGSPEPGPAARTPLIHRASVPVALGFLTAVVAMGGLLVFAGLRSDAVGLEHSSLPLVVYGATVVVGRIAFAKAADRHPPLRLAAAALLAMAAGSMVIALVATPAGLLVGTMVVAVGIVFCTPAFFAAIFAAAPASERGAASATASMALDLGLGGGPIVLGLVAQGAGIPWALALAAGSALLGAGWTARLAGIDSQRRRATASANGSALSGSTSR
ncbi:MAG TPA: MFS transporter [Nocardioides sp.]|nr:MFS transporter [Nocardioides sp.]